MGRGTITEKVNEIAVKMIGRKITVEELRLIAYFQYAMVNEQRLERSHLRPEEREILTKWQKEKFFKGDYRVKITVSRKFWDFLCEVIYEAYVDYDKERK